MYYLRIIVEFIPNASLRMRSEQSIANKTVMLSPEQQPLGLSGQKAAVLWETMKEREAEEQFMIKERSKKSFSSSAGRVE
ncbi:MAG: hypothetical protein MJ077_09500 [Oscillospiraceae bacterium]|nr:hypothetical protein [Oscillospiraceae bacterium]